MHLVHKYSIDRTMEEEACLSIKYKFQDFKWDLEVMKKWGLKEVEKMIKGEIPVNHSEASDEEIEVPLEQLSDIKEETHAMRKLKFLWNNSQTLKKKLTLTRQFKQFQRTRRLDSTQLLIKETYQTTKANS